MIVDMGRHNAYSSDTTAMTKVVIGMVFIVVLCVAAWCITDNPAFTWDKHVPCDTKGCEEDASLCTAPNCSKPFAVVFDVPAISGNIPRLCAEHADHFVNTITLINEPK